MLNFSFLLDSTGNAAANPLGGFGGIIMIIVLFVALYFFMIRPQKKQEKRDAEMRDSLAVGDEVTTIGGIIGKVVSIKGETFVLETTRDRTRIRFERTALKRIDRKYDAPVVTAPEVTEAPAEAETTEAAETTKAAETTENK